MKFLNKIACIKKVLIILLITIYTEQSYGQSLNYEKDFLNWFDNIIGIENTGLSNGLVYKEKYRSRNEKHKFFLSSKFLIGNINYENEHYFGIAIKYDLYEDEILVKVNNDIQLSKDKISSFQINEHQFIKINDDISKKINQEDFYEILLNSPLFKVYIKHKKKKVERIGDKSTYYEFLDDNEYHLFYENNYHTINKRKDLIKIFPEYQNEINKYSNKQFKNSEKTNSLFHLMKNIYDLKVNEHKVETK